LKAMKPIKVSSAKPSSAGMGLRIDQAEKFIYGLNLSLL
jgi:hypothetical protein